MQESTSTYQQEIFFLEEGMLYVNLMICLVILVFFISTVVKRLRRIRETRTKAAYQEKIEDLLFNYLFNDVPIQEVLSSPAYQKLGSSPLFQRVAVKAIVSLHHSYSGSYQKKLERFYEESGLVKYSLQKLESKKWPHIVEGIKDLSTLNYQKSYPRIASRIVHQNPLVRTEVILGLIKMKGISEIFKFIGSGLYLNDWVQSNILFVVKKYKIPAPTNIKDLLASKNKSVVLLAVRLINYYESAEHYSLLSDFYHKTIDVELKQEIANVLQNTEQIG